MGIATVLADQLDGTRGWTLRLIADVRGDDWTFAPRPGLAHPLWTIGHLAVSQDVLIHVRVLGRGILPADFTRHFPMGGAIPSAAEYAYPPVEEVRRIMDETHAKTLAAVRRMSDAVLAEPCGGKDGAPHPHYADKLGAVTHAARHEAFHAGQIALIRRMLGKQFLR
jgi:hypothetical protein